jgi:hypothetical protein
MSTDSRPLGERFAVFGLVLTAFGAVAALLVVPEVRQMLGLRPVDVHVDVHLSSSDPTRLSASAAGGAARPASSSARTPAGKTLKQRTLSEQTSVLGNALTPNQRPTNVEAPTSLETADRHTKREESGAPAPAITRDLSTQVPATVASTQGTSSAGTDSTPESDTENAPRSVESQRPTSFTSPSPALSKFKGMWKGMIFQAGALPYSVTMSIVGGQPTEIVGEIEYPRLKCGGKLRLLSVSDEQMRVAEEITFGATKCIPGGEIVVSTDDGRQGVWQWSNGTPRYVTTAKIRRE